MWIKKHRSFFMLIRIRTEQINLTLPLPLFLLDQAMDAIADLTRLWEKLNPGWLSRLENRFNRPHCSHTLNLSTTSLSSIFRLCRQVINELRRYGKWRIVEVETSHKTQTNGNTRIYIDFI